MKIENNKHKSEVFNWEQEEMDVYDVEVKIQIDESNIHPVIRTKQIYLKTHQKFLLIQNKLKIFQGSKIQDNNIHKPSNCILNAKNLDSIFKQRQLLRYI